LYLNTVTTLGKIIAIHDDKLHGRDEKCKGDKGKLIFPPQL
jgi:hypothetical protein